MPKLLSSAIQMSWATLAVWIAIIQVTLHHTCSFRTQMALHEDHPFAVGLHVCINRPFSMAQCKPERMCNTVYRHPWLHLLQFPSRQQFSSSWGLCSACTTYSSTRIWRYRCKWMEFVWPQSYNGITSEHLELPGWNSLQCISVNSQCSNNSGCHLHM